MLIVDVFWAIERLLRQYGVVDNLDALLAVLSLKHLEPLQGEARDFFVKETDPQVSDASFSKNVPSLNFTGERFIPGYGSVQIHMEHLQRYVASAALVDGRSEVLDYGCGIG